MKQKHPFLVTLDLIRRHRKKADEQIEYTQFLFDKENLDEAYRHSLELAYHAERITLLARALPAYTGNPRANEDVGKIMEDAIPVEIGFTAEGWFCVRLPLLLPRKERGSKDYVRSFLYPAMRKFFTDRELVRYRDCVLIYRHVYDRARPERRKRDHDNIEINLVSDTVALYVMPNDGPEVCSHHYCSAAGSAERTEVYVVPQEEFTTWYTNEKAMPDEGVPLYEDRPTASKKDV